MPSIFAYYRPRGVRGNYIVAILLDLLESETATVSVARTRGTNCGSCGVQRPNIEQRSMSPARTMDEGQERRWELYRIEQLIAGDTITVQVRDRDVIPYQETRYQAYLQIGSGTNYNPNCSAEGFRVYDIRFQMNNIDFGIIKLNDIEVIDWDKSGSNTFGEERQRVRCLLLGETKDTSKQMKVGSAIKGEVIQIEPDNVLVLVDNGTRFVGLLPTTEFLMSGVHVGDKITVYMRKPETHNSYALLSVKPVPGVIEQAEVVASGAAARSTVSELSDFVYPDVNWGASSNGHQAKSTSLNPLAQGRELYQRTKSELTERYSSAKLGQL